MSSNLKIEARLQAATRQFWNTRETQAQKQAGESGLKDEGARSAVTGGAQMNGFITLVRDLLCESGLPKPEVYCEKYMEIPGWYRPEKKWDLLIVSDKKLIAASSSNRRSARSATTTTTARRRRWAARPISGRRTGRAREPHFKVFPEFKGLVREALRDSPHKARPRAPL